MRAIYEHEVTHSRDVVLRDFEKRLDLHVSSSFLHMTKGEAPQRYGVIVVFSDVPEQRKHRKLKRLFGEYVDPRIVECILARDDDLSGGQEVRMTVLFADMRDFTGWSGRLSPSRLIELLNRFLAAMTEPISAQAGITDKFIGDAVMAFWGPPFTESCGAGRGLLPCGARTAPRSAEIARCPGSRELRAQRAAGCRDRRGDR